MPQTDRRRARKALIPAAGRGTRFLPCTKAAPKELAPIVTTPTSDLVVDEAARKGIIDGPACPPTAWSSAAAVTTPVTRSSTRRPSFNWLSAILTSERIFRAWLREYEPEDG